MVPMLPALKTISVLQSQVQSQSRTIASLRKVHKIQADLARQGAEELRSVSVLNLYFLVLACHFAPLSFTSWRHATRDRLLIVLRHRAGLPDRSRTWSAVDGRLPYA